jgi:hypothetical protein
MISIQVEGVERAMKNLVGYSNKIRQRVWLDVKFVGEQVRDRLIREFPISRFDGVGYPSELTYEIYGEKILICVVSGLALLSEVEKQSAFKGEGYFESFTELEGYLKRLINEYFIMAKERIQNTLHLILK